MSKLVGVDISREGELAVESSSIPSRENLIIANVSWFTVWKASLFVECNLRTPTPGLTAQKPSPLPACMTVTVVSPSPVAAGPLAAQ